MTDLILIDPPAELSTRFGKLAGAGSSLPSLGLCYLASVVRNLGFGVEIIDTNRMKLPLSKISSLIRNSKPRWVGISATTLTIDSAGKIAKVVKKVDAGAVTIVGGAHMTAVPVETMRRYPGIDIGVIGEGEETLKELVGVLSKRRNPSKVKGIIFREKGKLTLTGPRQFNKHLDDLPFPAWDLLSGFPGSYRHSANSYLNLPAVHLVTSRGCTGNCLFCDRSVFGRLPRMHSAKYILGMVEFLVARYGIREIQFFDDNFALFPKRLEEICRGLIRKKWNITWSCQARCDMINPKTLALMKKAGCWQIGLGIESGSDSVLKILQKGETAEVLRRAIEEVSKAGIEVKGYFIFGSPGETKETIEETQKFILANPLTYIHTTFFTPFPGSAAFGIAERYGEFKYKKDWTKLGQGTIRMVFIPKGLSKQYLQKKTAEIFDRFYFRPKTILYFLVKAVKYPRLVPAYIKGLTSVSAFSSN